MSGENWRLGWVWLTGHTHGPVYLIHSVTERCNLACSHCFVGDARASRDELSLQEIQAVAQRLPREVAFVLITGGEPFLRSDLAHIVAAYAGPGGVPHIEIATNGWHTARIVQTVQDILRENPALRLTVALSLDGIGAIHDGIRGRAGAFECVQATAHALRALAAQEHRLRLSVNVTVSAANQAHLDDLLTYLLWELNGPAVTCTLVRGQPRDPDVAQVDVSRYRHFTHALTHARLKGQLAGTRGTLGSIVDAQMDLAWSWVARVANGQAALGPCSAGRLSGVLSADGSVYACELRPAVLGNVRDVDYDLARIWSSAATATERARIRAERCACTHECFLVCNLLFNRRFCPALLTRAARQTLARSHARPRKRIPPEAYDEALLRSRFIDGGAEFEQGCLSVVKARQLDMLALQQGTSLLEVGFGRGELLRHCAERGASVLGIDYAPSALEIAQTMLRDFPEADLRVADCRQLPFEADSFERVFSGDVIEHLDYEDGVQMLREMYRVLKPGGFLLVHTTPNTLFTKWIYPIVKHVVRMMDRAAVEAIDEHLSMMKKFHIHEYNLLSLKRAARDAGLSGAQVWIDADILRSKKHRHTASLSRNPLVRGIGSLGKIPAVRFLFGNDVYLKCCKNSA